jgi:molybdenum cofactor cytidylyltransferase
LREPGNIAAIVLAAGASTRFGSEKLLHPLTMHGVTFPLAAHSLLPWVKTFVQVSVVVRPEAGTLCKAIEGALGPTMAGAIRWVTCADAARGMSASLASGVKANEDAAGWVIGLADMPLVPSEAIFAVREALAAGAPLAAPSYQGRRGHPVGFASRYFAELVGLQGDQGARALLDHDMSVTMEIRVDSAGIHADVDVPTDLRRF